ATACHPVAALCAEHAPAPCRTCGRGPYGTPDGRYPHVRQGGVQVEVEGWGQPSSGGRGLCRASRTKATALTCGVDTPRRRTFTGSVRTPVRTAVGAER